MSIDLFARRPILVNMLMLGMLIAGAVYYRANIKEQMPEIRINAARIVTGYPGVSAADIESLITRPIEDAIRSVEGIKYFNSTSSEGISFIWVEFKQDIESITKAVLDLQSRVNEVRDLPEDAEEPRVAQAASRHPAMFITLSAGKHAPKVLREVARKLADKIEELPDVGDVGTGGLPAREVEVQLRPDQLEAHAITIGEVLAALQTRKRDIPGGNIQHGRDEYVIRALAELRSIADIERIVVRPSHSGQHVSVGDLARVRDRLADPITAGVIDGEPGVVLIVRKEHRGDILRLSQQVTELLDRFRPRLPAGMRVKVLGNAAREVRQGLRTLYSNGAIGTVLVLICLWLFLGGRNAFIAALGLPVALLGAALVMYMMDITVNIVALFALILCVGIVVDDAIVIIENIYRHLEQGEPPLRAAVDGTREVMWPVVSAVLTTCAAFLPLLLMTGTMGKFFAIIPKVVVAALAASLVEALIILPSHMADFGRVRKTTHLHRLRERASVIARWYKRLLQRAIQRPVLISVVALSICGALVTAALMTKEVVLLGDEDLHVFDVRIEMPRGVTLDRTLEVLKRIEAHARKLPSSEVEGVVSIAGWSRTRMWPKRGKERGMVTAMLVPTRDRKRRGIEILADLRGRLGDISGPISLEVVPVVLSPPKGMPVAVRISGEQFPKLKRLAEQVKQQLRAIEGVTSITDDFQVGKRELRVRLDSARAALHGLSHVDIGRFIRAAYGGYPVTKFRDDDEELDVVVRYDPAARRDPQQMASILVGTRGGKRVALGDVATIEQGRAVSSIHRRDRKRTITVTADVVEGRATSSAVNRALAKRLEGLIAANPETKFVLGGEWERTTESLRSLIRAFIIGAILIFTILAAQFRSISQPLVVLLAIPLSLIGVVTGFFVSGDPVGMIALIGVVGLAGIAVNDSTVLIDFVNVRRRAGASMQEAIVDSCTLRLRPVLLTSITTIAGLTPLALGWGGSSESLRPMALAIVWGLGFCTVLTLVVVPCLYISITRLAARLFPAFLRRAINPRDES